MANATGFMNNAPNPIPGGFGNPAGANTGFPKTSPGTPLPSFGAASTTSKTGAAGATVNPSLFPANGYTPTSGDPMAGLSSGTSFTPGELAQNPQLYGLLGRELTRAFGRGMGMQIFNMLTKGMFNPQVANALINAMQPMRTRGLNDIQNSFGQAGARFSSAAGIGIGDFESQFAANEQATLANLFLQDQQMQLNLLEHILPTLHAENVNHGGSLFKTILGALAPVASLIPGVGPAISSIMKGASGVMGSKGGSGGGGNASDIGTGFQDIIKDIMGNKSGIGDLQSTPSASADAWKDIMLSSSAGEAVGGAQVDESSLGIPGLF